MRDAKSNLGRAGVLHGVVLHPHSEPLPFHANALINPVSLVFFTHIPVLFFCFLYQSLILRPLLHHELGGDADLEEILHLI